MLRSATVSSSSDIYQGLHVLLVTEDEARGKALTRVLRDQKARVGDFKIYARDPAALPGVDVLLVDTRGDSAQTRTKELRADVRARWASVVSIDFESLVKSDGSVMLGPLAELVAPHVAADKALTERAKSETTFNTALSPLGPSRTLRALSQSGHTLLVELRHPTLSATVEVANELLVSASAARDEKRWEAWSALVRILGLHDAEVMVARRSFTAAMNIMEPVDQALEVAAQERHCSAGQIAAEEAEAERAVGKQTGLPKAPDPRGSTRGPGYTPPRPVGRATPATAASASSNRTLMGMPTLGLSPKAAEAAAQAGVPVPPAPSRPAPAFGGGHRPNATLLGVAPGAVPGLAEMRAQVAAGAAARAEARKEPAVEPPAPAPQELPNVATKATPLAPPPAELDLGLDLDERELPDFDPPTGRVGMSGELLDTLDTLDELTMVAAPLSQPLPPPRASLQANDNDVPLDVTPAQFAAAERDQREQDALPPQQDAADAIDGTTPARGSAPSASSGLAEVADDHSDLDADEGELPEAATTVAMMPKEVAEATTIPAPTKTPSAPTKTPSAQSPAALPTTQSGEHSAPGEETWVVQRAAAAPKVAPKRRFPLAAAGLLALIAVAVPLALRKGQSGAPAEPARATAPVQPAASQPAAAAPATPEPAPSAPSTAANAQPALEPPAPSAPEIAPSAPTAEAPSAPIEAAPVPTAEAPSAPASAPVETAPAPVAEAPSPSPEPAAAPAATGDIGDIVKQGQKLLLERKFAEARPLFESGLGLDSANPHVRAGLSESLLRTNEPQAALPHAQAAVKLRPKRARYQVLLGDVLAALGKGDDARVAWKKALELDASDPEAKARNK